MQNNIVNLSVHKNNSAQRKRKQNRKVMLNCVKDMASSECVSGFYFISWDEEGTYFQDRLHDPEAAIGKNMLPSYVSGAIQRMINAIDNED